MVLQWRRCEASWMVLPNSFEVVKCVMLLGGVAEGIRHLPRSYGIGCCLQAKALIRSDRHDGGVLDVVPLLRASCLETWPGSSLLSSGVRCGPILIIGGAMHGRRRCVQDGVFLGSDQVLPFTCHFLFSIQGGWVRWQVKFCGSSWSSEVPTWVETWCCYLLGKHLRFVVLYGRWWPGCGGCATLVVRSEW